jgi:hypothetical protein
LAVAVLCGWVAGAGGLGTGTAHGADREPPQLPSGGTECVGASPVHYDGRPWPVAQLAPYQAWPLSRGAGITVAVVDSGVGTPPSLAGAVGDGRDVVSGGTPNGDCLGRGTALAGLVAGRPQIGTGVVGMAPDARVLPVRITDQNAHVPPDALSDGIQAATSLGADVILVGTGTPVDSAALRAAVASATAHDVLIVAPVNTGKANSTSEPVVWYPAAYPQVLAVAGADRTGAPIGQIAAGVGVDLYAPGLGIAPIAGTGHYQVAGSAVAAAYVAGAAALVRASHPRLSQAQVADRLTLTAVRTVPPDGSGRVDPYAAVADLAPEQVRRTADARSDAITLPGTPRPDPAVSRALWVSAAAVVIALVGLAGAAVVRKRRGHLAG